MRENDLYQNTLIATSTITNKSENQDSKAEFVGINFNALFIADGLGSYVYPKLSAETVMKFFKSKAEQIDCNYSNSIAFNFFAQFKNAKEEIIEKAGLTVKEEEHGLVNLFGTTAIVLYETADKIYIAYTGNGAIWHIRGNFNEFPDTYEFPWNAINYLNPHTLPEGGKEALYRLISDSKDFNECVPSVIEICKDQELGDIILICTDGIYSADQLKAGKNEKGTWVKYEPTMLNMFKKLNQYFTLTHYNSEWLVQFINSYLNEVKTLLDDDATLGILITKEALNYQKTKIILNESNSTIKL